MKSVLCEAKQNQAQNCIDNIFKYSQHILRHPNAMHNGPFLTGNIFGANSKLSIKTLILRLNR